jgi:hypothetical protein
MFTQIGYTQKKADTAALIKEFNKVMAFAVQPYLHYNSTTTMQTLPAVRLSDSAAVLHNSFFKLNDNLYYSNEQQEIYLQDSLMITIVHSRKSIQVSRVDIATKGKMDLLPLKKIDVQKMLRKNYTIASGQANGDTASIIIRSQEIKQSNKAEMLVEYNKKSYLPYLLQVTIYQHLPVSEQLIDLLRKQGGDVQKLIHEQDGLQYMEIAQIATLRFSEIDAQKEIALQMPGWKEKLVYDDKQKTFRGKDRYEGYEIIKTF